MQPPHALRSDPHAPPARPHAAVIAAGAAATLVAAAGGWMLAGRLTDTPVAAPEARPSTVQLGEWAQLSLRSGWRPVERAPAIPGLEGATVRAFAPADGGGGRMVLALRQGVPDATLPEATPAAALTPLGDRAQKTKIGGISGSGYTTLALRGVSGIADIYTAPTAAGQLAVVCLAPVGEPLPVDTCPDDVVSVTARTPPAPDTLAPLRAELPAIVTKLNATRASRRRALRTDVTARAQARDASRLAAAYRAAAERVATVAPKDGLAATLPGAFTNAAEAYATLAQAATAHDARAWSAARAGVRAAEQAARAQLDAVRAGA